MHATTKPLTRVLRIAQTHPRVLVTPEQLELLRHRVKTTHQAQMQSLLALVETPVTPDKDDPSPVAWRLAFLALLTNEARHVQAATAAIEAVLTLPVSGEYFVGARRLKALACAYDWLHGVMDPALRRRIGERALAFCQALYDSGEIEPGAFLSGHGINQIPFTLMAGISLDGEIEGARGYVDDALDRFGKMLQCYRHFLEGDAFPKSYSYTCTYMGELPYLFQTMEAGLGMAAFEQYAWWRNVVRWWTYALRSDDMFNRQGDYFCAAPVFANAAYYRPLAAIAARYRDPLAQWWVERFHLKEAEPDQIIFEERERAVTARGPESLPRCKHFAPMGVVVARGDFHEGTVAHFKCTPLYLHNHCHRDANSICIYHKGDLAIDSGAYDGYETPHWYNYYIRTIAHNTLVVHDPEEVFDSRGKVYANDGGQRFVNQPHFQPSSYDDIFRPEYRDGRIVDYREGDGWSYVCGDASGCYSARKLSRFLRHVVFLLDWPHPTSVSLVVLDEVTLARPGLTPRILLHALHEPEIDDANRRIICTEGRGRLSCAVLWPEAVRLDKIGGAGREFWVDGQNYPLKRELPGPHTPGAWRVEISPIEPEAGSEQHRFLTVLMPTDRDALIEAWPTAQLNAGEVGVRCGDRTVVFGGGGVQVSCTA